MAGRSSVGLGVLVHRGQRAVGTRSAPLVGFLQRFRTYPLHQSSYLKACGPLSSPALATREGYRLAMRVAVNSGREDLALELYGECQESFLATSPRIVVQLLRALGVKKDPDLLLSYLRPTGGFSLLKDPEEKTMQAAINALSDCQLPDLAKQLAGNQSAPSVYVRHAIIAIGDVKVAKALYQDMIQGVPSCLPTIQTYNLLIEGYGKRGKIKSACNVFEQLLRDGYKPNGRTFEELFSLLKHPRDGAAAQHILKTMETLQVPITTRLIEAALDSLGQCSQVQLAEDLFDKDQYEQQRLEYLDIRLDLIKGSTYLALLQVYIHSKKIESCLYLIRNLRGSEFDGILEEAYSRTLELVYKEMIVWQIQLMPSDLICIFGALISSTGREDRVKDIRRIFSEATGMEILLDALTYHRLLGIFIQENDWGMVTLIFRAMLECGFKIPMKPYQALLVQTALRIDPSLVDEINASFAAMDE
jgi:pentatricopeptide repeat protein